MEHILEKAPVKRVATAMAELSISGEINVLGESARTAQDAASSLNIEVGQIASSLIFKTPDEKVLLIITSGRHRVDTELVARTLGYEQLLRVEANFVKEFSGFSIGGVPLTAYVSRKICAGLASLPLEKLLLSLRQFAASLSCRSFRSTAFVSGGI